MKNRKRYGRKIKRSKTNLYKRKKTPAQKAFGTVLLLIGVCAAVFLGYCLGKPLLEFLEKSAERKKPEWTPPATVTTPAETEPDETDAPTATETEEAKPAPDEKIKAVTAPSTALLNSSSLSAFAARAKSDGCNTVLFELKDESGYLHYASPTAAAMSEELILSPLTAAEISETVLNAGLTPIAAVSVLSDDAGCRANPDLSYKIVGENVSWLDYSGDMPIRHVNPESEAAGEYLNAIVGELNDAGITVLLKDLAFPDFQPYDRRYIAGKYFEESRSALLAALVPENTPVEMLAEDVLTENYGQTAELLREKSFTNRENASIAVRIRRESFPTSEGYPADAAGLVEDLLARIRLKTGAVTVIPVIESGGFSAAELSAIQKLLADRSYIIA